MPIGTINIFILTLFYLKKTIIMIYYNRGESLEDKEYEWVKQNINDSCFYNNSIIFGINNI